MSSAVTEQPDVETFDPPASPNIAVDPLMAGNAPASGGTSFSEIAELPPLKEVYIAPDRARTASGTRSVTISPNCPSP